MPTRLRPCALALLAAALLVCAAPAPAAPVPAPVELDPYLPADTETFVTVHLRQIIDSPLFKKYGLEPIRDALRSADEVNDVLKDLALDPFTDIDRVTI